MLPVTPKNFRKRFPAIGAALSETDLQALLIAFAVQELAAGEAMIIENAPSDTLFLVWDGELNVTITLPDGEREIARRGPGDLLGEISLLNPGLATATVRTEQGCIALHMHRSALEKLWESHPRIANIFLIEMARAVSGNIRSAVGRLNAILEDELEARLDPLALVSVHTTLYEGDLT